MPYVWRTILCIEDMAKLSIYAEQDTYTYIPVLLTIVVHSSRHDVNSALVTSVAIIATQLQGQLPQTTAVMGRATLESTTLLRAPRGFTVIS